eukprot:TRINITY_DN7480_c0_g1_i1.p1 TRINITY_DN7480_c0_g1~~TRINITY_DN7480_c0_g1_i1.p1  ORF type:complete len:338 (-),score=49.96 TRINITY_DN7480_c0_g1_i1:296-1309(-)
MASSFSCFRSACVIFPRPLAYSRSSSSKEVFCFAWALANVRAARRLNPVLLSSPSFASLQSLRSFAMGDVDELGDYLASAVEAAKRAGEMISTNFNKDKNVEHKGKVDLVTETDKACEDLVFRFLKDKYPNHKFIGEESSAVNGTDELSDLPTWIIDPVDGTTNFVHRFPFVCISIGLTISKIPTVGVVYNPILGELFTAVRGRGAFLNGIPIKSSSNSDLGSALLAAEIGTKRDKETVDAATSRINWFLFKVRSLRVNGSCALNLCGVACGRLDLMYELGFGGPWDVAAGVLIVQEAGGCVFDPSGKEVNIMSQRVAACNGHLKESFLKELKALGM